MRVVEILFYDTNKVKLVVAMPDPDRCTTECAPHLPRSLFRLFPHLERHKCHNGNGYSFKREAMNTEVPHLFEHLIIELQSQARHHDVLKGETQWNWRVDPRGTFHVHVEYENEVLVLAAIRLAEQIVNSLDRGELEALDVDREMAYLRQLADVVFSRPDPQAAAHSHALPMPQMAGAGAKGGKTRTSRPRAKAMVLPAAADSVPAVG